MADDHENMTFRLASTYELVDRRPGLWKIFRIEIFRELLEENTFRARVWMQNSYNMYPASVNTGKNGEDLRKVHSCDQIDSEITLDIAEDPSLITGRGYNSEKEFRDYVVARVWAFVKDME